MSSSTLTIPTQLIFHSSEGTLFNLVWFCFSSGYFHIYLNHVIIALFLAVHKNI